MAFVPKRLYQGQMSTTLTTVLATTTTAKQWVITDIEIVNNDTATRNVTLALPGSGAANRLFNAFPVQAGETVQWTGRMVTESTETITGGASAASVVTVTISGAEG